MDSAETNLVRERDRLVLLFTPPFDHSTPSPGYIMGYPPGLRENGGQYTHGALWMAMAWARLHEGDKAVRLLQLMNPIESNRGPADVARYRGEPYVVAADVSSAKDHIGQSGWTWYTGSAAWMYRIWIEEVLGFRLRGDHFTVEPSIPADWPGFELTYRHGLNIFEITVSIAVSEASEIHQTILELDGTVVHSIPVDVSAGTHQVSVRISRHAAVSGNTHPLELVGSSVAGVQTLAPEQLR